MEERFHDGEVAMRQKKEALENQAQELKNTGGTNYNALNQENKWMRQHNKAPEQEIQDLTENCVMEKGI